MTRNKKQSTKKLSKQLFSSIRNIAGSYQITACLCSGLGLLDERTNQVLLVIRDFRPRLMHYVKTFDEKIAIFFAVDQWIFERDIERGFLGEALAGMLIFPYKAIINENYLYASEVKLKKRLIIELLENIALSSPELSYEIQIEPQYFMYETILRRVRLFPPMIYSSTNLMYENNQKERLESVLHGYLEALNKLENERIIRFSEGYVKISNEFIKKAKSQKVRFMNIAKIAPRALFTSLLSIFPQVLNFYSQNKTALFKYQKSIKEKKFKNMYRLPNPQKYLHVPTAKGLISLSDKVDIEILTRKILSVDKNSKIGIEEIGGVLNDVYLVHTLSDDTEKKALVKQFKDWSSFKWFPLTLWTIGTRTFAVLATSRLEKEFAINTLLDSNGFNVPKVLYVNPNQRLIFMEYIEGENLDKLIKHITKSKSKDQVDKDFNIFEKVGEIFAKVHNINVSLGDTKPENILVKNGKIYLLDLEQASRDGDKAWDIAEFLYYSGHYVSPLRYRLAERIAKAFIKGYLNAKGNIDTVVKAGNTKYTRVFSVFTFPSIIFAISNVCKDVKKMK